MHASGTFIVSLTPRSPSESPIARMSLDKRFHGDLDGASTGEMLGFHTQTEGSAGYVALELVTGTLGGRDGTFALQHSGTMERGQGRTIITVVPDSATNQLTGLTGTMTISIVDGKHYYEFEYSLPT